jgi:hypothetical protein
MANPLQSLTQLKKSIASRGWFRNKRLVYHGLGPVGAHMFYHFMPISAIIALYYGDEVRRYIEGEWGTKVFSYEEMNAVRLNDSTDYHTNFLRDHGKEIAAYMSTLGGDICLAPFAPSPAIHEFLFTYARDWHLLTNVKIVQDYFEYKARLALEAKTLGIPMPPESRVIPFGKLDYAELSERYDGGFVMQTPLASAGSGTEFVFSEADFERIVGIRKKQLGEAFAAMPVKVTQFLSGPSPNCTGCVVNGAVVVSQPDIQIVGDPYFVKRPGQYIGSDFTVRAFSPEQKALMFDVVKHVGRWMGEQGYRGNFGVDFLSTVDKDNRVKDIFVSEVNARLVGESQYLADFQAMVDSVPLTFFHLAEWMNIEEITPGEIEEYNDSLPDIQGSALTLYTKGKGIFKAAGGITAGIYRCENGKLIRVRDGYLLSQTKNSDEFVLSVGVPWEGLVLGHPRYGDCNVNICYILTRESIVDPHNFRVVSRKWRAIADLVYDSFKLTPCDARPLLKEKA